MKNTVLKYGLIIGSLMVTIILISMQFLKSESDYNMGEIFGYSTMIIVFSFMFIGIKSIRENNAAGNISFGRALSVGLLITLVSCIIYSLIWTLYSEYTDINYMESYVEMQKKALIAEGLTQVEIDEKMIEYAKWTELYKNPFLKFLFTVIEPLPVGIIMSFFLALILKRKNVELKNTM